MTQFLLGATMVSCWVVSLFFVRFWKETKDPLFQLFALAFFVFGLERLVPAIYEITDESRPFLFAFRLAGFILILIAIAQKNRKSRNR